MPEWTNTSIVVPSTSRASASSADERFAAAAGLFSSCASPAAIVPSDASRSRFCSMPWIRFMTGRMIRMIRWKTARCISVSSTNRSVGTVAMRQSVWHCMRTPTGPSVSAAIAPIQVGATCSPAGSTRSSWTIRASMIPSSSRCRPRVSCSGLSMIVPAG